MNYSSINQRSVRHLSTPLQLVTWLTKSSNNRSLVRRTPMEEKDRSKLDGRLCLTRRHVEPMWNVHGMQRNLLAGIRTSNEKMNIAGSKKCFATCPPSNRQRQKPISSSNIDHWKSRVHRLFSLQVECIVASRMTGGLVRIPRLPTVKLDKGLHWNDP